MRHRVIEWPWWFGDFAGFAFGPLVFVRDPKDLDVLAHELVHVHQFWREPFLFWIKYLWELIRKGYENNRFEREARERTQEFKQRYLVKDAGASSSS